MVFFKAQKLQRLAEMVQQVQKLIEEEGGDTEVVKERLDGVAREAGVDLDVARLADVETLERVLAAGGAPEPGKAWAVAEALYLDGVLAFTEGRTETARARLRKAEHLYDLVGSAVDLPEVATDPAERRIEIARLLD